MGESIQYIYDIQRLYSKIVDDMIDSQLDNGLVPDIAPEFVPFAGGFRDSPEWGSSSVIIPWLLYKWYGDLDPMIRAWDMMTRYMAYLESKSDQGILSHGLGDWFDLGQQSPGSSQLTPLSLTATAIWYHDLILLSEIAQILGKAGISIEALIQKEPLEDEVKVPVILLTNRLIEKQMNAAIEKIEALPIVDAPVVRIRVETLK